jgi:1,4-alpha-glucan branching enzyme
MELGMLKGNYILRLIVFCSLVLFIFNPFVMARDIYLKPYTHTFSYYAPDAANVAVIGTFNSWDEENGKMIRNAAGYWEKGFSMDRGIQQYAYLVDGIVKRDPLNNDIECIDYKGKRVWISYLFIP